jgi:hypothetical protein
MVRENAGADEMTKHYVYPPCFDFISVKKDALPEIFPFSSKYDTSADCNGDRYASVTVSYRKSVPCSIVDTPFDHL